MTEHWKPVVGFEGYYEVSDQGRVRSVARDCRARWGHRRKAARVLSSSLTGQKRRYLATGLSVNRVYSRHYVHVLVLEAFKGPRPPGKEARHLNGKSTDNRADNLTWGTADENRADKMRHGTHHVGSACHQALLHETDIPLIRAAYVAGVGPREIARRHGVSQGAIHGIIYGSNGKRSWSHV